MFFEKRVYKVKEVYDIDWLAQRLTRGTWCLCNGFKFSGVWFLNDSTSEDGVQEYAAITLDAAGNFIQVESISFGWCSVEKAKWYIMDCVRYAYRLDKNPPLKRIVFPKLDHVAGACRLCA